MAFAAGTSLLALAGCTSTDAFSEKLSVPVAAAEAAPAVASVDVTTGALTGGTTVTVAGTGLAGVTAVTVGGTPATSVSVGADGNVAFVTPAAVDYKPADAPIALTVADGTVLDSGKMFSYQAVTPVDRQMQYAFTYWKDYNLEEWSVFSDNDCGNYVNQTLIARGWEQNDDWFSDYGSGGGYSLSWIRGNEMDRYIDSRPDTTRLELADRTKVKVGDVVMFDWDPQNDNGVDHTMLVSLVETKADGTNSIKFAGHTVDAQYRDLDEAITVEHPGGTAHFYSIA